MAVDNRCLFLISQDGMQCVTMAFLLILYNIPILDFIFDKFDITTTGDWDCVAAVERLPVLHYRVHFIFLSFGIMGFIVEL